MNYRPEYSHQWNSKTYYTQLRLDPLGKESAEEMLSALLGDGKDLIPLKRLIIERTEGNPFFMEEMVQVLFDEGALVRNGAVKLTQVAECAEDSADGAGDSRRAHRPPARRCKGAAANAGGHRPRISAVADSSSGARNRMTNSTGCSMTCNWASSSTSSRRSATPNNLQARADAGGRLQLAADRAAQAICTSAPPWRSKRCSHGLPITIG